MTLPDQPDPWSPPRLRARLAELKGLAPAPVRYVIWRSTTGPNTPEVSGYELPDQSTRRDEATFDQWLADHNLAGADRLAVSVLVIREQLDKSGLIREGVLERRRGSADGPWYGNVARVEFTGAAKQIRRYRAARDGRLTELPAETDTGTMPAAEADLEAFAGEDAAVHAWLGADAVIIDRRPPSVSEDLVGLSAIIHARRRDGVEIGVGVGWHGGLAFVLAADFPRQGGSVTPPADFEAAVETAVASRGLIRYETRLDAQGFRVIGRVRGQRSLVSIRLEGTTPRIEPYHPGRTPAANDDQRRWMTYAETYESRTILDSWVTGETGDIAVLTIDTEQEAWRHVIDPDGVEVSRLSDNEAAVAVLYRELAHPPDAAPVPEAANPVPDAGADEFEAPADSLLTKALAWSRATALLTALLSGPARSAVASLNALIEPMIVLGASFSLASLRQLIARAEAEAISPEDFADVLDDLVTRFRDELARVRIVTLPVQDFRPDGEPPFGPLVELHFPAAAYDIEEAVQCLALRRSTAAVSHAAKVLRLGVAAAAEVLGTGDLTGLPWARMIAVARGADRDVAEALSRVRRAWRAPGLPPADRYTEEEAEAVLAAVEAFMRLVAGRMEATGG